MRGHEGRSSDEWDVGRRGEHVRRWRRRKTSPMPLLYELGLHRRVHSHGTLLYSLEDYWLLCITHSSCVSMYAALVPLTCSATSYRSHAALVLLTCSASAAHMQR